ncbi:MAG: S-adenosylmethionine:tRNA ribosyltransferase-isomerase [Polyangiaceae bacterium]
MIALASPRPASLRAGTDPRRPWSETRVLGTSRAGGAMQVGRVATLDDFFSPGDLLVLNDAATLPASLVGRVASGASEEAAVEVRLATTFDETSFSDRWRVVLFGEGDWRTDTDRRPLPPSLRPGDHLAFAGGLTAVVEGVDPTSWRLVDLRFDRRGDALGHALYAAGSPIQYAHLPRPLRIAEVQTPYAARPWAVEMPSTGRPLAWRALERLEEHGVELAFVTHAAGLSATGDPELDRRLPLPERYELGDEAADKIVRAKAQGRTIIAAGTTVVRAVEASRGRAGFGIARQRMSEAHRPSLVDGILTGVHSPGESHWDLLAAFAPRPLLHRVHAEAIRLGLLSHELGDLMMLR